LQYSATFGIGRNPYCGGHRTGYLSVIEQCCLNVCDVELANELHLFQYIYACSVVVTMVCIMTGWWVWLCNIWVLQGSPKMKEKKKTYRHNSMKPIELSKKVERVFGFYD
jgi:hypothetical protein